MSDLSNAKRGQGSIYPIDAFDSGGGPDRVEPLLDVDTFRNRFLFGIPLRSPFDPTQVVTPDMLRDFVKRGVAKLELDSTITVSPIMRRVKLPFDVHLYDKNIWCEVPWKPISKVKRLAIVAANYADGPGANDRYPSGNSIFEIPPQWVDLSYAAHGKIFVNPLSPSFATVSFNQTAVGNGATILNYIGIQGWVPGYWAVECETGLASTEGSVPVFVNEAIGQAAAMIILDNLIPLFRSSSQSLGIDGMSQSSTDDLNRLLTAKREQLEKDYLRSVSMIKSRYGIKLFVSNV